MIVEAPMVAMARDGVYGPFGDFIWDDVLDIFAAITIATLGLYIIVNALGEIIKSISIYAAQISEGWIVWYRRVVKQENVDLPREWDYEDELDADMKRLLTDIKGEKQAS